MNNLTKTKVKRKIFNKTIFIGYKQYKKNKI